MEVQGGKRMGEKVKIKSGMRAEIRTEDGKIHSGIIRNIEEAPEVTPYAFSWEEVQEKGWEARRWEAAVAAMQGLLAGGARGVNSVTSNAFMYADALAKKFKEEEACCK